MPNIKSAKKRVLVTATKTAQNRMAKTAFKTELKKYSAELAEAADKQAVLNAAYKAVDQACANGLLHKNTAARKKSAFARAAAQ